MTYVAEVKDKKEEDQEEEEGQDVEGSQFDQVPTWTVCPHCGLSVTTFIDHESSWVTYAVVVVLILLLGWAAICVVPVVYPLFKDVVHHCPRCLSVLATRSRVELPSFRNKVMSFRCGNCVIVLARRYVMLLIGIVAVIGGVHFIRTSTFNSGLTDVLRGEDSLVTWEDFMADCGLKSYLRNPIHVSVAFNERFKNHTVRWEGKLLQSEEGFHFFGFSQKSILFVRMSPTQLGLGRNTPDLALYYDSSSLVASSAAKIEQGSQFRFEATLLHAGKRGMPHTMLLWSANVTNATASKVEEVVVHGTPDNDTVPRTPFATPDLSEMNFNTGVGSGGRW